MSDSELTPGEIGRSLLRIESALVKLANDLQVAIAPVTALEVRMDITDESVNKLGTKVEAVQARAAFISGGIAGIGAVVNFLFGGHKG